MALSTYSELATSIADWMHRSDLTSVIPDWVTLLESKINRRMRLRVMETDVALTTVASTSTAALPTTRFLAPMDVFITWTGSAKKPLTKRDYGRVPFSASDAPPAYWCIDGTNVRFDAPISSTSEYAVTLRYWKALALQTDTTNQLLTQHPDVYLFGAMTMGARYVRAAPDIAADWRAAFGEAMAEVAISDASNSDADLTADPMLTGMRSNILEG